MARLNTPEDASVDACCGMLAAAGAKVALEQMGERFGAEESEMSRDLSEAPLIANAPKIIERFLSADPSVLYGYLTNFFGCSFLRHDAPKFLAQLDEGCARALAQPANKEKRLHRLVTLPTVARIHAATFLREKADSEAMLEPVSALLKDASDPDSGKANQEIIEITYLTLDALMANQCKAARFRAGAELLEITERICDLYLSGHETLQFAAVAAWHFLLSYEVTLRTARQADAEKERNRVRAAMNRVLSHKSPNRWWLKELSGLHKLWRAEKGGNLPQYEEFSLYPRERDGCYPKLKHFLGLMRANMAGAAERRAQACGKDGQNAFLTPKRARESVEILYDICRKSMRENEPEMCLLTLHNLVESGVVHGQTAKEFEAEVVSKGPKDSQSVEALKAFVPFSRNEASRVGAEVLKGMMGQNRMDWAPGSKAELIDGILSGMAYGANDVAGKKLGKKLLRDKGEEVLQKHPEALELAQAIVDGHSSNRLGKQVEKREYGKTESNQGMSEGRVPELAAEALFRDPRTVELKELRHPKREIVLSPEQLDRNAEFRQLMEELGETNQTRLGKLLGCSPNHISGVLAAKVPASRRLVNDLRDLVKPQQPDSQIFKCLAEEVDPAVKAVLSKILREVQSIEGKHRLREAERVLEYAEMTRNVSK